MIGGRENVLYEKAYAFALRIIKAYRFLTTEHKEYVLSKQLLRCGTSIGGKRRGSQRRYFRRRLFGENVYCL